MEYNYGDIRRKIIYSKIMKSLHGKESPIYGYSDAGNYVRDLESHVATVATLNGMNSDYCSVLALTRFLGLPPYGREGAIAIKELFGKNYNETTINMERFKVITGLTSEAKMKEDLIALSKHTEVDTNQLSNEARCVMYVEDALRDYNLLSPNEREKLGDVVLKNAMLNGIKKDESGKLQRSNLQRKISMTVSERENNEINDERVEKAKNIMRSRMISAVLDEQAIIENIIGD